MLIRRRGALAPGWSLWTACVFAGAGAWAGAEENWPAWRGPSANGIVADRQAPLKWSAKENIVWKVALPGPGNSTPIVWGDRLFVTCASEGGAKRALLCFAREDGKLLWERSTRFEAPEVTHDTNPQCSSSPTADGERVYAWHGSAGLFCYDFAGNEIWKKDLGVFEHIWGVAASPVLFEDLVILNAGPGTRAFVAAFRRTTGEEVWRYEPPTSISDKVGEYRGSWSTPLAAGPKGGESLLISLPVRFVALNPRSGEEIWFCEGLSKLAYTSPLASDKVAVAMCGFHGPALAARLDGAARGDITKTHRLWLHNQQNPQRIGSGVLLDGHVYMVNENGAAWCIEAQTGKILWEQRVGASAWSSLVYADGRFHVIDQGGKTLVLEMNPQGCKVLAENPLGETTRASLVICDGRVFARTYKHLYCFGK